MLAVKTAGIKYAIAVTLKAHSCRSERETEKEQENESWVERKMGRGSGRRVGATQSGQRPTDLMHVKVSKYAMHKERLATPTRPNTPLPSIPSPPRHHAGKRPQRATKRLTHSQTIINDKCQLERVERVARELPETARHALKGSQLRQERRVGREGGVSSARKFTYIKVNFAQLINKTIHTHTTHTHGLAEQLMMKTSVCTERKVCCTC